MTARKHDNLWRQFQDELATLETKPSSPLTQDEIQKLSREQQLVLAKTEFRDIQRKYGLSVAEILACYPEEESVAFLQSLMS